MRIAQNTKHTV